MKSKVYFTKTITPEKVLEMYEVLGKELKGNIAVKLHSGEEGNQNFLKPDFWRPIIDKLNGTVVECNTAYEGSRNTTEKHLKTIEKHGWSKYFNVDLMDAEGPDMVLDIPEGKVIQKNYVGKDMVKYDGMIVLSHFKGHPMGGYGGALKQLSIGCASSYGKAYIHGAGEPEKIWTAEHDLFLESMADAAKSVHKYFKDNIVYINVMKNMSVDCDCCAVAEDPCMDDIGILISTDPIAIDQACINLVYASNDKGRDHLIERIESRNGVHTIEAAAKLGYGDRIAKCILKTDAFQKSDDGFRHSFLTGLHMMIGRPNFIAGTVQVITEGLLHILFDFRLAVAGTGQKNHCRRSLRAFDALRVVVGNFGGHFCHFQRFVQRIEQPSRCRHPHSRAVAKTTIGLRIFCVQPPADHPAVTGMGIFTAPEPHFMLHCTKCSLRQTLSVNQTNCHRSGHDGIIGEVRFLAQQREILVLVIVVVEFKRTADHIAQNGS